MNRASFGKYRLIAKLGHGGMADVYLAVAAGPMGSRFSKLSVVKRLRQNLADDPEFVEMLVEEARIAARLNHPNVVQTNEVGSVANRYFIAMEYLEGQPLHRILQRAAAVGAPPADPQGPSSDPFPKACRYLVIADTLAGLHHAHELADYDGKPLEIVHRDVTPHNVFVTYEGQTKVVDFGIARAAGRASETRQGVVKGKVRYMAPEQALGHRVDRRADLFSVGIMLWEAAAGRRMWQGMEDLEVLRAVVNGDTPISPSHFGASVPREIDAMCQKALAYHAADRYATAEDFRLELEQFLATSGELVGARRKLVTVVASLFHDKRAELRGIIEKQLAQLEVRSSGAMQVPAVDYHTVLETPASAGPRYSFHAPGPAVSPDAMTQLSERSTKSTLPLLVAGIALVALGGAAILLVRARVHGPPPPAVVAAVENNVGAEVRLTIAATPPTAQVSIDGEVRPTPVDARMLKDGRDHLLRVEAPGFLPHVETLRFESDLAISVALTASSARAAPTRPPPPIAHHHGAPQPSPPAIKPVALTPSTAVSGARPPKTPKINIADIKDDPWDASGKR